MPATIDFRQSIIISRIGTKTDKITVLIITRDPIFANESHLHFAILVYGHVKYFVIATEISLVDSFRLNWLCKMVVDFKTTLIGLLITS